VTSPSLPLSLWYSPPTDELNAAVNNYHRMQYARWKEECREMDSHVGSGKIITAPIINEDGFPIKDPLVLLEATSDAQGTSAGSSGVEVSNSTNRVIDRQIIDWKLTLHQIGKA